MKDHEWARCPACGDDLAVSRDPDERVAEIKKLGERMIRMAEKYRDPTYWPSLDPEFNNDR